MLYPTEAARQRVAKLMRNALKEDDPRAAAREILRLDPHCAAAHMLLGSTAFKAGRIEEAERHFWDGLAEWPCSQAFYVGLADARRAQSIAGSDDQLTNDLQRLAYRKIWMSGAIPQSLAKQFNETIGGKAGLDFNKPESFLTLAEAIDSDRSGPADARLRPYLLLDMLQDQADEMEVDEDLIGQIRRSAEEVVPVFESALREWANHSEVVTPDAICLIIALLGEIAPVSALDNLLDASETANGDDLFLHCHWAIWRISQRFPEAAMERFRARIPDADASLRCGIAEQFSLMPKGQVSGLTLLLLLKDFARIAGQMDADYLLSATVLALETHGCLDEAKAAIRRCRPALPKTRQRDFDLMQAGGFTPRLTAESIAAFDIEAICLEGALFDSFDEDLDEEDDEDLDEEDDDVIEAPVAAAPVSDPIYGRLFNDVMSAGQKWDPKLVVGRQAFGKFYGPSPGSKVEDYGFGKWYICDFRARAKDETLVERYLRERGDKLTARERTLLESWRDGLFSIWEVDSVERGKGVELKDLCGVARMFVSDVSSSRSAAKGDCLLVRVEQFEGKWELGGDGMRVPRNLLSKLLSDVKNEAIAEGVSESAWVRANSHQMHRKLMAGGGAMMPELRTFEGDALEFSHATYEILDETAALTALRGCAEFEETEVQGDEARPIEFAWLGETLGKDMRRSYGRIEMSGGRLRLECNSRKRLEKGRNLIAKFAGPHVKHLADSFETAAAAMKRGQPGGGAPVDPEISKAVITEYKELHYAKWPDERLPALGGKSPREAVKTKAGRQAVADLIRDMESREKRAVHGGTYDFSKLRAAVGLTADE